MPVPTRAWCRPPWPSVENMAPARTACWPGIPTAPGARPRPPASPCTRPMAPSGTSPTACRRSAQPHGVKRMHCVTCARLSCRGLIQEMSGDASACPGKLLVLAAFSSGTARSRNHFMMLCWCGISYILFFFLYLEQRSSNLVADPVMFLCPFYHRTGC